MLFEWIEVPAGFFVMGASEQEVSQLVQTCQSTDFLLETPQRMVYLDTFQMSKYPVTHAQYRVFLEATGYPWPASPYFARYMRKGDETLADHPIGWISWFEAIAFCQWVGCRLPTEAEWEKAARGPTGLRYPWGNDWQDDHCNADASSHFMTTPVGMYPQGVSPYGVHDLIGNVWEWVDGWVTVHAPLPALAEADSLLEEIADRFQHLPILRGGCVGTNRDFARGSFRFVKYRPDEWGDWVGFRCVKLQRIPDAF